MKKRFFAKHAKSSAALVSLGIHGVLILIALSFVAVTVIQKDDQKFEAKPVNRPKMELRKLKVPVNIKKKKLQKPKLRKRIVVQPKMNQRMPDIKMPEITGVKGGLGNAAGSGLGGAGALGFSMPEFEIFGVKGKGEKIFLILDTGNHMLVDEMGGIPAYTIIKQELIRIVDSLPPTALFNVCVFNGGDQTAFPNLVAATDANARKLKDWIEPLNISADWSKSKAYGIKTLGPGGVDQMHEVVIGKFAEPGRKGGEIYGGTQGRGEKWYRSAMLAMQQQADTVFLLTNKWGYQRVAITERTDSKEWFTTTSDGKKWMENVGKAKKLLAEENKKRAAAGQPPRVITHGDRGLIRAYFPNAKWPPPPDQPMEWYNFTPKDFVEAFLLTRKKYEGSNTQFQSRLKKKKNNFTFNVVQFVEVDGIIDGRSSQQFGQLTKLCKGDYQTIAGLEEIQGYVSAE